MNFASFSSTSFFISFALILFLTSGFVCNVLVALIVPYHHQNMPHNCPKLYHDMHYECTYNDLLMCICMYNVLIVSFKDIQNNQNPYAYKAYRSIISIFLRRRFGTTHYGRFGRPLQKKGLYIPI